MNKQQLRTQCDSEKLELFLRGSLGNSETEILELHLTECDLCARQIQLAAAQGVSWHEAQSLLAADEYDCPQHVAAISSLLSDDHDPMTRLQTADVLSREIRGWLDPTDDPRSMGRFAGYEIVGIVGHGGMGIVLKGFETSLNRFIAIKILAPRLATNGSARKRFAREAQAAAAVRHDNVIAIHRVDEWHGLPFLVMPYAGGMSLQKRIDSDGPLSIEQTLRVGVQIASGLAAAHAQGLIHRDIKPANILLEQGVERVTITDFGLARAADDASVTRTGVIAGTPQYMSPEQAEAKQLDARSDLFSLGSVLYAMATGRPPFRGAGSFEVLKRIVNDSARPMREIQSSVPEWFENIVNRLHSKSPNDRPSSAGEVAELLQECLAHLQQPAVTSLPESLTADAKSGNSCPGLSLFNRRSIFNLTQKGVFAMLGTIGMCLLGMVLWQTTEASDISGQWTSDEWGTVVLEAREPGQYEGTFTGSDQDKPDYDISDIPDIPVDGPDWFGHNEPKLTRTKFGTIQLKWSRVERRFNGTWRKGITRSGRMSLRLMDNEIRGAWTTNKDAQKDSDGPRLADLMWKRNTELPVTELEDSQLDDIAKLPVGSTTDEICSSTTPPDPTRILIELEMQRELKRDSISRIYEAHKDSFRIIVEPVYDRRVPVREYPIIGRASLHLLRYKCTVHFSPVPGIKWPLTKDGEPETEVTLYVDSDHLHRAVGGKQAVSSLDEDAAVPGTSGHPSETDTASVTIKADPELEVIQLKGTNAGVKAVEEALSRWKTPEPIRTRQSDPSAGNEVGQLLSEIAFLNKREELGANSARSVRYGADVMRLTNFGAVAVPSIIDELDRTDDPRMIATLAFVLRAIGDKRGVPALIRAIPRTDVAIDDCNWIHSTRAIDKELIAFFRQHKFEGQGEKAIGCSNAEIELGEAFRALTGGWETLTRTRTYGRGTPIQIYLQKKLLHGDARRLGSWWDQHSSSMVDDVAYLKAAVPEFQLKSPGIVAPNQMLATISREIGYYLKALRSETATNDRYVTAFLDLDTGRSSRIPEQWRGRQLSEADIENLLVWAENEGFDLTCDQYKTESGKSHFVLRGIGLKAWQLDEKWTKDDVLCTWGEIAEAGRIVTGDRLVPFDKNEGVLDPTGTAPFLVVTREGSPVLVDVGVEATADSGDSGEFSNSDALDNHVLAKGRMLDIQLFEAVP